MSYMFGARSSLNSLNISHFNIKNLKDMNGMFEGCASTYIDKK